MADLFPPTKEEIKARRSRNFAEAMVLMAKGYGDPLAVVKAGGRFSPEVQNIAAGIVEQQRAAIGALNTNESSGDALISFANASASWIASLFTAGIFDRTVGDMVQLPLMVQRSSVITDAFVANEIDEAFPKKVARLTLETLGVLRPAKAIGLTACSQELLRQPGARDFLDNELRKAVITATDVILLSSLIGATVPITSTGDPASDFASLVAALRYGSNAKLYYVVETSAAGAIATKRGATGVPSFPDMTPTGGTISGVPTLISDALASGTAVLFDAAQIGANSGEVRVDTSEIADLQLDDAPTNSAGSGSPSTPTATTIVNLWQTNSVAIKVERYFLHKLLRSSAVASLSGINYSGGSP